MTPNQQRTDVKAAAIQNQVNSAAIAVLTAVDSVKAGKLHKGVLQLLMDAVALLGRGSMDVSLLRRQLIRPSLGDYQDLCKESIPITELLFGDDFAGSMKDVKNIKNVTKVLTNR